MGFDPNSYKEPVKTNYLKLQEGANTIRTLVDTTSDQFKTGWEYWTAQLIEGQPKDRPTRITEDEQIPLDEVVLNKFTGKPNYTFFWAFPVYSFENEKVMIFECTQATVRRAILANRKNPKWGDITEYNFQVVGEKNKDGKVSYTTSPEPKEELLPKILKDFKAMNLDMDTWMAGNDPFAVKTAGQKIADEVVEGLK